MKFTNANKKKETINDEFYGQNSNNWIRKSIGVRQFVGLVVKLTKPTSFQK